MSTRCDGVASRSFIIGSRLCPPAATRASGPSRSRAAMAPSTLVARSYSNGAGVCKRVAPSSAAVGEPFPGRADVLAPLVLLGRAGADHGRPVEPLGAVLAHVGIQLAGVEAAVLRGAQHGAVGAGGRDRGLAPQARERERSSRVDLAYPRRVDLSAL